MTDYLAPAKLNLSLLVMPPRDDGYHPLESLVQTVEWCDRLEVEDGEGSDSLEIRGVALDPDDNLVLEALRQARSRFDLGPLTMRLTKELPIAAGLGGGSSDAAAALRAAADIAEVEDSTLMQVALGVGADVPLFLSGGSMMVTGVGDGISRLRPLGGFAVTVVVPGFGLSTPDVYERWDRMDGPEGDVVSEDLLPPALRGGMPMRNDLLPAALGVEPRLGDFMADVKIEWGTAVCLSGSGSACFGYFADLGEARDAAAAVTGFCEVAVGLDLRDRGVERIREDKD